MNTLKLFENADNIQEYSAGATIFEEGQAGDLMYVVLEGEVEIRAHGQLLNKLGPGDLVGEMALIDSRPRSASAVALTRCRVAPVDENRFLFMVQQSPFFAIHIMRELVNKLRAMTERVSDLQKLLIGLGFDERVKGDHHIFTKDDIEEILNLQPKGSMAKPYQVKQVRDVIVRHKLGPEHVA